MRSCLSHDLATIFQYSDFAIEEHIKELGIGILFVHEFTTPVDLFVDTPCSLYSLSFSQMIEHRNFVQVRCEGEQVTFFRLRQDISERGAIDNPKNRRLHCLDRVRTWHMSEQTSLSEPSRFLSRTGISNGSVVDVLHTLVMDLMVMMVDRPCFDVSLSFGIFAHKSMLKNVEMHIVITLRNNVFVCTHTFFPASLDETIAVCIIQCLDD
mmetsp:Transcript_87768/g.138554  ORF Transcript_87768/g.138554 Transcript_87768/m.138554 type:complete len:210 (-) Transcript_87768:2119-2748(-)